MKKQREIKFGIVKKLLFYFLTISLVPLIIAGSISFIISKNQFEENTKMHLSDLAGDCGRKISYYVNARYQDIRLLLKADVFEGNDREAKQRYINDAIEIYPYYKAFTLIDLDGKIIACTREELIGDSRADREWFQKTIQSKHGEVIVLDAYNAETAGWEMVIGFNISITDESGKEVIGVLTTRVSMDHIIQRVQTLDERTSSNNHSYLLNRKGEILAGPDENKFLTTYRLIEYPVVKDLLAGKTGISEYKNDRGEKVVSARYVLQGEGDFDGWGWGIILTESVSEAYKAAFVIRRVMILLIFTLALFITWFAVYITRRFARPIIQVSKSALRIGRGDLGPVEIKYNPKDEIGQLVSAFNKMSEDLNTTTVSRDSLIKEVAERKQAEEALQKSKERFRALTESTSDWIWEINENAVYTYVSPKIKEILGYEPEEIIGKTPFDLMIPEEIKRVTAEFNAIAEARKSFEKLENANLHKDGRIITLETSGVPIFNVDGKFQGYRGFNRDITERKQAEEKLKEYSVNLEKMVDERTRELKETQETLIRKERLACLGEFSGSISHELRNPLGVINSSLYYLNMKLKDSDEKVLQYLEHINSSVDSATMIIDSLLSLTQMKKPKMKRNNLVTIVSDSIVSSKVPGKVKVLQNFPDEKIRVNVEREQSLMAFKNIIKNAVEAMDGEGTLAVVIRKTGEDQVEVSFKDTGCGISSGNLDKIFQPLFCTKAKGIGFGLSVTKMIIESHGGTIRAESESGKGANFIISLPLC